MSNRIPVRHGVLKVGESLRHDIFDRTGKLLLRHGTVLETESMVEHLESMGHFDPEAVELERALGHEKAERVIPTGYVPQALPGRPFAVFAELAALRDRLQGVFDGHDPGSLAPEILAIASTIRLCCSLDQDASLANIHLPLPGAHNVRHAISVATLAGILLQRQKHDPARMQSAIAAALTMNLGALDMHHDFYYQAETLADEQRARIQAHPRQGVEALLARGVKDPLWLAVVLQHHEAFDGSGYPAGLAGDRILAEAQVVSLSDRYCAMVAERAQREPLPPAQALKDIRARHASAISPSLFGALMSAMGLYPPGSYVRLANGETAVVVHRLIDPRHPVVFSICNPSGVAIEPPRKRLTASPASHAITSAVKSAEVKVTFDHGELWPPATAPLDGGGATAVPQAPAGSVTSA